MTAAADSPTANATTADATAVGDTAVGDRLAQPVRLRLVHVIANPASGRAADGQSVADALRQAGAAQVVVVATTAEDPGLRQASAAVQAGCTLVVACGGDGTVRACAAGMVNTDVPLAVIPAGTGNLLAHNLGIPTDVADAIEVAVHAPTRRIDVGDAGGEIFTVMAGIGFDAMMIRDTNPTWKARLGSIAYVASALRHLRTRPAAVHVEILEPPECANMAGPATMVLAGNLGTLTGGLTAFPDADPTNGSLELAMLNACTLRSWLAVLGSMITGSRRSSRRIRRGEAVSMIVRSNPARPWELDGEDRPAVNELRICVKPAALLVCVPADVTLGPASKSAPWAPRVVPET